MYILAKVDCIKLDVDAFAMADYRLARQMPQRYCNTFFYYCVAIMI